jgi:hypothetical protein
MFRIPLKIAVLVLFLVSGALSLSKGQSVSANGEERPIIHIDEMSYSFPPVYEGEELSHTFIVFNKGTKILYIEKVTHS